MAKKTTVDETLGGDRAGSEDDSPREQAKSKGSGTVEEAIDKGKPQREGPGAVSRWMEEIPRLKIYVQEVVAELKKVQWPTRKQVRAEVVTVLSTVVLMTVFVYGLDRFFTVLSNMVFK